MGSLYADTPISLILLNRNWYSTFQDPHTHAEWLIYKYGRAQALFHLSCSEVRK
ncbi:hypothetical protein C1645_788841 [Glomus cerebriforme]|uniref:Uncharacterized protein n=1 Tax=Glomus cerebriforme TaxID=658196 RepID=A0A397SDU9_9GLOM|nr:hypothetical protein C1645_788841 [Glomus cerebriforme]